MARHGAGAELQEHQQRIQQLLEVLRWVAEECEDLEEARRVCRRARARARRDNW